MEKLSVGSIVFVHFPFSNLQQSKLRPAVVISEVSNDDWILCQITSRSYADVTSIEITDENFQLGRLYPCYLKMQSQQDKLCRDDRHKIEV